MRRRRSKGAMEDTGGNVLADLFMGFAGIVFVLFVAALAVLGVPEVSHAELKVETDRAEELQAKLEAERATWEADFEAERAARQAEMWKALQAANELENETRRSSRKIHDLQAALDRWKGSAAAKSDEIEEVKEEIRRLSGELSAQPLDVVIVIDGTSSMQPSIERLRGSVGTLAEIAARVSPRFRLGIVVARSNTTVFPLTQIAATEYGHKSEGMQKLHTFIHDKTERATIVDEVRGEYSGPLTGKTVMTSKLDVRISIIDFEAGVRRGLALFPRSNARQLLVVIGDMGPFELGDQDRIEPSDHASADRTYGAIKRFAGSGGRVLALYTGDVSTDLSYRQESRKVFQRLAASAGKRGTYSSDAAEISAITIAAALKRGADQ